MTKLMMSRRETIAIMYKETGTTMYLPAPVPWEDFIFFIRYGVHVRVFSDEDEGWLR